MIIVLTILFTVVCMSMYSHIGTYEPFSVEDFSHNFL